MGEDSNGVPNNLLPYVAQMAVSWLENLRVGAAITPRMPVKA